MLQDLMAQHEVEEKSVRIRYKMDLIIRKLSEIISIQIKLRFNKKKTIREIIIIFVVKIKTIFILCHETTNNVEHFHIYTCKRIQLSMQLPYV